MKNVSIIKINNCIQCQLAKYLKKEYVHIFYGIDKYLSAI